MDTKKILLMTISPDNKKIIPLALYYIKAYFEKNIMRKRPYVSVNIKLFSNNAAVGKIIKSIMDEKPDILGLSCYVWNIEKILKVARIIKKKNPQIKIILGGPEVSPRAEELLKTEKSIDVIVRGEGEETFLRLVESLIYDKNKLPSIKGISYRNQKKIITNLSMPLLNNVDLVPSPYLSGLINLKNISEVPIETMRGCPYRCHYCYEHKDYNKVRYFSQGRVDKELKWVLSSKPSSVFILDATFNANSKRAKDILRIFVKHKKVSKLRLAIKAELLDEGMIELISRAGVTLLEIGIQTINARTLKTINRTLQKNVFKKNIKLLNQKLIPFQLQLIALLPYDTYENLKQSLDWACDLHPPGVEIFDFMVLPGTYLRQHAKTLGIKYRSEAPYAAYKSNAMSDDDYKKVAKLRDALKTCYNNNAIRSTLYAVKNRFGIPISGILEEWSMWKHIFSKRNKNLFLNKQKCDCLDKLIGAAPQFLSHLCSRYRKKTAYKFLYPTLKKDIINFIASWEKLKHKNTDERVRSLIKS
jgi:radical SAM superfamily enzyme YgiQ (UPF0313 family)